MSPRDDAGGSGELLALGLAEALERIRADMLLGMEAAVGFQLHPSCEPCGELVASYRTAVQQGKDWHWLVMKRIGRSWMVRDPSLVWLDDKVAQVARTASICGRELHLPILAHAAAGDAAAEEALRAAASALVARDEPMVVKPRHGSNSKHVRLWPTPGEAGELAVLASVDEALTAFDETWKRESWNQNAVERGALLQPLYAPMCPDESVQVSRPLELKLQVLFGTVVGGTLSTHSNLLWVMRSGGIQLWDLEARGSWMKHKRLCRQECQELPPGALDALRGALRSDWSALCGASEQLALTVGLDELRVDWLLGDARWGPRIGELTYMGTCARPASAHLARAFAAAHLQRLEGEVAVAVASLDSVDPPR